MNKKNENAIDQMLETCPLVEKITKPLVNTTPIKSLHFYEIHPNGEIYSLSSLPESYHDYIQTDVFEVCVPKIPGTIGQQGFSLLDYSPIEPMIKEQIQPIITVLNKWSLGHECEYILQKNMGVTNKTYALYFYGDSDDATINHFFLNNTTILKYFTSYFLKEIDPIIKQITPYKIASPLKACGERIESSEIPIPEFLFSFSTKKKLSRRQLEILLWHMKGKTVDETAEILNISKNTVETHIYRMKQKLNCKTKSQIVYELLKDGLSLNDLGVMKIQ